MLTRSKKKLKQKKGYMLYKTNNMNYPILDNESIPEEEENENINVYVYDEDYLSQLYSTFESEIIFVTSSCTYVFRATSIYFVWIFLHYAAVHLYAHWCVPIGWIGFLTSPLLVASPQCKALRWAIYNGGNSIDVMWIAFGLWIVSKLHIPNYK